MAGGSTGRPTLWTRPFTLVTLAAFGYFASYAMLIPALPAFVDGPLGGGDVAVGVVGGGFAITALLLRPFAGSLGDRRGRRLLIVSGTASAGLAVLGLVWTSSLGVALGLRLVAGVGEALFFVGAASAITDMAPPERRGEALSLFSIALYTGVAGGPYFAEVLLSRYGFDATFAVSAALSGLACLIAIATPDLRPEPDAAPAAGKRRLVHPAGVFPGVVMVTSVIGFGGFMAFVRLYATEDRGLAGARELLLMYGAILVAIRLFGARVPDRYGAAKVGLVGLSGSAIGLAVVGLVPSRAGLFAGTAIFACGQALAFPAFMALAASSAPPAERGAAVGTTTAFIDFGFFVGPVLYGFVATGFGRQASFLAGAIVAACGVVLQLAVAKRARERVTARLEACETI